MLLCDLEGKTHAQAAIELNCGEATVQRRLARRELLRSRLLHRGVTLSVGGLALAFGRSADASVPARWVEAVVRAAESFGSRASAIAIGEVVSTTARTLARQSLRSMVLGQLRTAAAAVVFLVALAGIEHLDMAVAAAQAAPAGADQSLQAGVNMISQQLKTILAEAGLEEVDGQGKAFDPKLHEAISQKETRDVPEGQVVQQLRKGYRFRGRLFRPAGVIVARKPAA